MWRYKNEYRKHPKIGEMTVTLQRFFTRSATETPPGCLIHLGYWNPIGRIRFRNPDWRRNAPAGSGIRCAVGIYSSLLGRNSDTNAICFGPLVCRRDSPTDAGDHRRCRGVPWRRPDSGTKRPTWVRVQMWAIAAWNGSWALCCSSSTWRSWRRRSYSTNICTSDMPRLSLRSGKHQPNSGPKLLSSLILPRLEKINRSL